MEKVKKTEMLLKEYSRICCKIQNLELEIKKLEDMKMYCGDGGLKGIAYDGISTGKTYKITSIVENELLANINLVNRYKHELNINKILKQKIDNAMQVLRERDREIIKLSYFNRASNKDVARQVDLTEQSLIRVKKQAVKELAGVVFI